MRIIIPMAGQGKRLRPTTLTVHKPLIPIAGKSIVRRLSEKIAGSLPHTITDIGYVVRDIDQATETELLALAESIGAQGHIFHQNEPLGTAHAILCARPLLDGPVTIAFADTLFYADISIAPQDDGVIWVKKVEDPRQYGVVVTNEELIIERFEEKPETFVSDLAIIGIYYFKDGRYLAEELQYLLSHDIRTKGEYQLTDAMEHMRQKGRRLRAGIVDEWLDCGNRTTLLHTLRRVLERELSTGYVDPSASIEDSVLIPPYYVGPNATVRRAVIGPGVSIEEAAHITDSLLRESLIFAGADVQNIIGKQSVVGRSSQWKGWPASTHISDYSICE